MHGLLVPTPTYDVGYYLCTDDVIGQSTRGAWLLYSGFPPVLLRALQGGIVRYVRENLVNNWEVTVDNINRDEIIYGPIASKIKSKMIWYRSTIYDEIIKIYLPPIITQPHLNIALGMDFFTLMDQFYSAPTHIRLITFQCNNVYQDL